MHKSAYRLSEVVAEMKKDFSLSSRMMYLLISSFFSGPATLPSAELSFPGFSSRANNSDKSDCADWPFH